MEELKSILNTLNAHQTSICKGIPEEKLITWANRKNISQILIERFSSKIVFRDRNCSYVMLETDQADICRACAMLLSTSSMDMMEEQELECPFPECDRAFKYQGALDKHIIRHNQVINIYFFLDKITSINCVFRMILTAKVLQRHSRWRRSQSTASSWSPR